MTFYAKHHRIKDYKNYYFQQNGPTPILQIWFSSGRPPNLVTQLSKYGPHIAELETLRSFVRRYIKR